MIEKEFGELFKGKRVDVHIEATEDAENFYKIEAVELIVRTLELGDEYGFDHELFIKEIKDIINVAVDTYAKQNVVPYKLETLDITTLRKEVLKYLYDIK